MQVTNQIITLISINYFPEDTAIGLYSSQMTEYLVENGHTVNVITGFPYYPQWKIRSEYQSKRKYLTESLGSINIYRYKQYVPRYPNFFKRVLHLMDFTIGSFFNLRKIRETDVIMVVVPFTSSILLGWLLKRRTKAKLWIHVQDFEFDAALQSGVANKKTKGMKKMVFAVLYKIEKWLFSKADVASSISYSMLDKLKLKTKDGITTHYFPNWIDTDKINPLKASKHPYFDPETFNILYSGNIGEKQDWIFFMQYVLRLDANKVKIIIVGDGSKKDWVLEKIRDYEFVKYFPPVSYEDLSDLLCSADLHILFQKENVIDSVMPSKLLGMMASGRPSLVTGNEDSEVKTVLLKSEGGVYESNINLNNILNETKKLIKDKNQAYEMGQNARSYVVQNFGKEKILNTLKENINTL